MDLNRTRTVFLIILSACVYLGARAEGIVNVRDYGATGYGTTLDHAAINAAIEACSQAGGGKASTAPYPEQGTTYPEPKHNGPTPAYGLFARHVDGLYLHNVTFELSSPDERPERILEDVTRFESQ